MASANFFGWPHGFWSCLRQIQMTNSSINAVMNLTKLGEKHKQMRRTSGRFPQNDHTKNGLISYFFWPDSLFWTTDQSWTETSKHIIVANSFAMGVPPNANLNPWWPFVFQAVNVIENLHWEGLGSTVRLCIHALKNFAVRRVLLWWLTLVFGTPLPKGQSSWSDQQKPEGCISHGNGDPDSQKWRQLQEREKTIC